MLESINQYALDVVDVLDHARHQVAGGAVVEPAKRQQLNVRIKIAPQIEDDFLLERVVQNDPQRVECVLKKKYGSRYETQRQQLVRPIRPHDIIDDHVRHTCEHDH